MPLDRCRRAVEARHLVATTSQIDCVVAKAASSVKYVSANCAERFEFHKTRLGIPDVPRDRIGGGRAGECGFAAVEAVVGLAVVLTVSDSGRLTLLRYGPLPNVLRCAQAIPLVYLVVRKPGPGARRRGQPYKRFELRSVT